MAQESSNRRPYENFLKLERPATSQVATQCKGVPAMSRSVIRNLAMTAASVAALGSLTGSAWGYALNAHVAICQHVLDRMQTKGGGVFNTIGIPDMTPVTATADASPDPRVGIAAGAPRRGTFTPYQLNPEVARIVFNNPSYFRAGCGAPDAFPFFGNTDPSHSYGWDPATQAEVLWEHAKTDQEKAWVIGWKAHLAMDGAVHGFANTYAALAMKRHVKAAANVNRPQVWDTFTPSNFLGHIAAESWVNSFFVYAANPASTKLDTPTEFAQRMYLSRGSPLRQHYSRLLSVWKPGSTGDIKTKIAGERPGVLATLFHRGLEHLNQFEEYHTQQQYLWTGHMKFYDGKSDFDGILHHFVAKAFSLWHQHRVEKIHMLSNGT